MPAEILYKLGEDVPLHIPAGSTFDERFRLSYEIPDPDPEAAEGATVRVRQPLDGWLGRGQVRKSKKLTALLLMEFEIDVSQEVDVDVEACGEIGVHAGALMTALLNQEFPDAYYNVELYDEGNADNVVRVFQGPVETDLDVTEDE